MTAKEYLEQARFLDMRINAKLQQLEELKKLMLNVGKAAASAAPLPSQALRRQLSPLPSQALRGQLSQGESQEQGRI